MKAVIYNGAEQLRVEERPKPVVGAPTDALLRVTSAAICGSDLHIYHGAIPEVHKGDVIGHEFMGIVEEVGREVQQVQPGDRVVASAIIADGVCWYCQQDLFSLCEGANPNPAMMQLYGYHIAGAYGYSHLMGGYDGGHAEYVRVPFADVGLLKVPGELTDDQVLLLSDTACTGWMAAELAGAGPGQTLAVFGCGPIGLMAMESARVMGIDRIIAIDNIPYRLDIARNHFEAEVINFDEHDPVQALRELTHGRGPDACIEAAGFRYARSPRHKIQRAIKLETDSIDALSDAILGVRKGGTVAIIGDFIGLANQFPIGAMMEKGLTVRSSQVHVQHYWRPVMELIQEGVIDPTFLITHHLPLERAPEAFKMFDQKSDEVLKVILEPSSQVA
jgi:threonine dehydrogenase-like Zn-dependent dehydrogenase